MLHDPALVLVSFLAVGFLVWLARIVGASDRIAPGTLRKALHALIGAWTVAITPRFHHLAWAIVPPVAFLALNASPKVRDLMPRLATGGRETRGLWTFPLGVALVYLAFWEESPRPAILAGLAVLALADPVAAIVGSRYGQRRFQGFGDGRSLEGSAAFFVTAALAVGTLASLAGGGAFPWRMGVGCGAAGAVSEAISPSGWDNLTIPLAVAAVYRMLA